MEDTTFVDYMNQNWPENGPAPADAEEYIAREEGQDFLEGIYHERGTTVEDFDNDPVEADFRAGLQKTFSEDEILRIPSEELSEVNQILKELAQSKRGGISNVLINARG